MKIRNELPHGVREIEHAWIPLRDGCRLAARLWLPEGAERAPVPAVVEYIPYGKRVGTRERDEAMHHWFAGPRHRGAAHRPARLGRVRGRAARRVPAAGAGGRRRGDRLDRGAALVQRRGRADREVLGRLQRAADRGAPAARAARDRDGLLDRRPLRRRRPLHGRLPAERQPVVGRGVLPARARSRRIPTLVGPGLARACGTSGSRRPSPTRCAGCAIRCATPTGARARCARTTRAIECPVYAVGGWADALLATRSRGCSAGLRVAAPRSDRAVGSLLSARRRARPRDRLPAGGARWWHALAARRRGHGGRPRRAALPGLDARERAGRLRRRERPGRWVAEAGWPSPRIEPRVLRLAPGRLGGPGRVRAARPSARRRPRAAPRAAGWSPRVRDQREDDARSLCFDSEPLAERLEILGAPELRAASSRRTGRSRSSSRGCATSRPDGSVDARELRAAEPDPPRRSRVVGAAGARAQAVEVRVRLNDVAHAFPPGHRLRLALSNALLAAGLAVAGAGHAHGLDRAAAGSRLPVRPPDPADADLRAFEPPERARATRVDAAHPREIERDEEVDPASGDLVSRMRSGYDEDGRVALARLDAVDLEGGDGTEIETRIHPADPLRARAAMASAPSCAAAAGRSPSRPRSGSPARGPSSASRRGSRPGRTGRASSSDAGTSACRGRGSEDDLGTQAPGLAMAPGSSSDLAAVAYALSSTAPTLAIPCAAQGLSLPALPKMRSAFSRSRRMAR